MISLKNKQRGSALFTLLSGIVITATVLFLLVKLAGSGYTSTVAETTESATETRIMPSGTLKLGDGAEPGQRTGKQVFDKICLQCHGADSATAYAPKITKNDQWAPRIAKGFQTLVHNAVNGFQGQGQMPARGGAMDLTDDEVARAVAYMINQSGGTATEPPVKSGDAAAAETPAENAPAAENTDGAAAPAASGGSDQAKAHFESKCVACHAANSNIPFAPKLGNKADWEPRIKQGKEVLFKHAIEGFTNPKGGMMPAKGGFADLSDDEVKAIVVYMANEAGAKF